MLFNTQLSIPILSKSILRRERLLNRLHQGVNRKLTLVAAPAGYGKTTLLATWATRLEADKWRVVWLSLQEQDDKNGRFFHILQTALGLPVGPPNQPNQIEQLLQQLNQQPHPTVLILDDYHLIKTQTIHRAIQALLAQQPPHLHLVLGTRQQPPLKLARWRANQQLNELTQHDLAFSEAETAVLFRHHKELTNELVGQLAARTEGWAAGLQLAQLMLNQGQHTPKEVLAAYSGSQRTLFDYLTEEVFQQQSAATQRFLMQTSILEHLTADLCHAVTLESDSVALLTNLIQSNLFIIQVDSGGNWFRYHHLFAEFLRRRLALEMPEQVAELQRRACDWHRQNGNAKTAVSHALATNDQAFALATIADLAPQLLRDGDTATLVHALQPFPAEAIAQRPDLALSYAFAQILQGRLADADAGLQAIMPLLQPAHLGAAYVVQTMLSQRQGDIDKMLTAAEQAHTYLGQTPTPLIQLLSVNLSELYTFRLGKNRVVLDLLKTPLQKLQQTEQPYLYFHCINLYGATLVMQGQLQAAHDLYQQALRLGERWQTPYLLGAVQAGIGKIFLEWGDLTTAETHFQAGLEACRQAKAIVPFISNAVALARLYQLTGQQDAAPNVIAEARQFAIEKPAQLPRLTHWRVWRKADNGWVGISVLGQAAEGQISAEPGYPNLFDHLKSIQLTLATRRQNGRFNQPQRSLPCEPMTTNQMRHTLNRLYQLAEQAWQVDTCLDIGLTQVTLEVQAGKTAVAQQKLIGLLILAKPFGYLHSFSQPDTAPLHLLQQSYTQQSFPNKLRPYALRILAANGIEAVSAEPIEPLTLREQEVLVLLMDGYTNKAIAKRLHLTVGTVRWHARNIYGKLDAKNRTHAVARARSLGFLT